MNSQTIPMPKVILTKKNLKKKLVPWNHSYLKYALVVPKIAYFGFTHFCHRSILSYYQCKNTFKRISVFLSAKMVAILRPRSKYFEYALRRAALTKALLLHYHSQIMHNLFKRTLCLSKRSRRENISPQLI